MSDDNEERPPASEELARNHKKLFGENVVPFPEKKEKIESTLDIINKVNIHFATTLKSGRFKVINELMLSETIFMDKKDFVDLMASEKMLVQTTDPGGNIKAKYEPISKLWLEHPKHRHYRSVVFDPGRPFSCDDLDYNMWPGFAVKSKRGQCYKFLQYVKNVLCNGNKNHYRWLMAWTAHIFQCPGEKPETAVAIQGEEQGTGKSFFPLIISRLLNEKSYFVTSNAKMITGDFSGHLEHTILLHAEEAFRAESEREDSIIKNIISEEKIGINPKGVEAKITKNFIRLILTGNPPHIVKAGRFARRFLVLKISNKHVQDTNYFDRLLSSLNNHGYEALMYYFMHYPINKFNLRIVLKTEGLLEQKLDSLRGEERFWYTLLYTGELPYIGTSQGKYYGCATIEYHVIKYKLINHFQRFMNKRAEKNRSDEVSFGIAFSKFFPMVDDDKIIMDRDGKQMKFLKTDKFQELNHYIIPPLNICRKLFDIYLGQKCDWPDDDEWVEKQYGD